MTLLFLLYPLHAAPLTLDHTEHILSNGMQLIVHEDHRAPLFAAELRYRAGAADDPIPGLAHLVEHLMFEGSASAPEAAYDRWLAEAGASNNAWTSHDATTFTVVGPTNALELTLFLESDRMGWMLLDEEDLINQLAVVFSERELSRSAVGGLVTPATSASLFPLGHPYRGTVLGEPDPLAEVSLEQIQDFVDRWYQPANAILVVGGAVSTPDVIALAEKHFSDVPVRPPPARATAPAVRLDREVRRVLYDEVDPTLLAVWPTVPRLHPDEPVLDLLADVLTSRLARGRLSAVSWTTNRRLAGRLSVRLIHPSWRLRRSLRVLERELSRLKREPVPEAELARLQHRWRVSYARRSEGLEERVAMLASCAMEEGAPDCIESILQAREAVTPADILAAARTYLGEGRLLLSSVPWRSRRHALPDSEEVL